MAKKKCMVFETLGNIGDLQVQEGTNRAEGMRLSGVFGVCGVKNNNNRVYDRDNYGAMVENLQRVIATEGCPGELEHPNTMNINLENVSHKIESIQMNEDGTITGTILLLNTPKGQIAQEIINGGLPLYISSRGAGTITNEGRVNLTTLKTYDLVGTPGFSQAKLNLKENQTVECLNESLSDGNIAWAIVENDESGDADWGFDTLGGTTQQNGADGNLDGGENPDNGNGETEQNDNKDINKEVTMNDLKDAIDKLTDKVTTLEAQLHVAQESVAPVNYDAIEQWVTEEFAPKFKEEITKVTESQVRNWTVNEFAPKIQSWITEEYSPEVQKWITEEFAPVVQKWVCEQFAPEVQNWVTEEFAPEIQNWIVEEYSPAVQNWITEEYSPEVQGWITEEFAPAVQGWITEEYSPVLQGWLTEEFAPVVEGWINDEYTPMMESKVNTNVSKYLAENQTTRLEEIDSLLEAIADTDNTGIKQAIDETRTNDKYAGMYCVENMPAEYSVKWNMISEEKKDEIVRSSRMYDFTKNGVLESFWANVKFDEPVQTLVNEGKGDILQDRHNLVAAQMKRLRRQ